MARSKVVMTREAYIPTDYREIKRDAESGVLVLADESGCIVMGFAGRAQKPAFHFRYRSPEVAAQAVASWFGRIEKAAAEKKARKEQAKAERQSLKVGTVLVSSWGYDQTNIDFYEVTEVIGSCTVVVREIAQERSYHDAMQGSCIPVPGKFVGAEIRRRVSAYGGVKVSSCQVARAADYQEIAGCKVYRAYSWTAYA